MDLDLHPFVVGDLVCSLDEGAVDSDVGCLVGCLGASVSCPGFLGSSLEDLVVV